MVASTWTAKSSDSIPPSTSAGTDEALAEEDRSTKPVPEMGLEAPPQPAFLKLTGSGRSLVT